MLVAVVTVCVGVDGVVIASRGMRASARACMCRMRMSDCLNNIMDSISSVWRVRARSMCRRSRRMISMMGTVVSVVAYKYACHRVPYSCGVTYS